MYIKGTGESTLVMDSPVSLMHHDPDRSWITDPDPDHPKGTQPKCLNPIWEFALERKQNNTKQETSELDEISILKIALCILAN